MTLGDAIDRALGGPEHYTSHHCSAGHHQVCMEFYGGRSCECACHHQPGGRNVTTTNVMTPTEAMQELVGHARSGEHGTYEFPCHIAPGSDATVDDVIGKVCEVLRLCHVDGTVMFDGTHLTVTL